MLFEALLARFDWREGSAPIFSGDINPEILYQHCSTK